MKRSNKNQEPPLRRDALEQSKASADLEGLSLEEYAERLARRALNREAVEQSKASADLEGLSLEAYAERLARHARGARREDGKVRLDAKKSDRSPWSWD
jgi:hypothetical protein